MTVYMLRDNDTGLFYRRTKGRGGPGVWVAQEKASIWTLKIGPAQAKSRLYAGKRRQYNLEIIPFHLTEITDG